MRRGFIAAAVAGAAGITLGLMPVGSAFASGLPQTYDRCSDWRGGDWWRNCCDPSRGNDRPSWCWDDVRGWYHDSSNSNWHHDDWNDSWRGGNGGWNDWNHHDDWNDGGRGGNGDWGHDNWNHDNRYDGGGNGGGWNDGRHDWGNWNN